MIERLVLCLMLLLLGYTDSVIGSDTLGNVTACPQDSAFPGCNCSFTKGYNDTLDIPCVDSSNNCTWFHMLNNSLEPIEEKFCTSDKRNITLLRYYDNESYGYFVAINSSSVSCYYLVAPLLNEKCYNCTGIKINGSRQNNNDVFCTHVGDNMIVQAEVPLLFNVYTFALRLDTIHSPENCMQEGDINDLTYTCSNLTASNIGEYCIHVSFRFSNNSNPEWSSNNVTVIVQSLTISFTQSEYIVNESIGVQPAVFLNGASLVDIMVEVFTTDITAFGNNMDYGSGPYPVTVPAENTTNIPFDVKINNDNILEGNKTFRITINATSLPGCVNRANPYEATVTIVDDDVGSVRFENGTYNFSENSVIRIILILSQPSSNKVTVTVDFGNTATGGDVESADYHSGPHNITFPVGETRVQLNVTIVNDNILENNETFNLTINSSSLPSNVKVGNPGQATVTIRDDDVATVKFDKKMYCFTAGDNVQPTLILNSTSSTDVTIEVYRTNLGEGVDSNSYNVTFLAGDTSAQFNVSIYDASEPNGTFRFDIIINSSSLPYNIDVGNPGQTTVTQCDMTNGDDDDDDDDDTGAIIGGVIGGIGGILILSGVVGIILFLYLRRNRGTTTKTNGSATRNPPCPKKQE